MNRSFNPIAPAGEFDWIIKNLLLQPHQFYICMKSVAVSSVHPKFCPWDWKTWWHRTKSPTRSICPTEFLQWRHFFKSMATKQSSSSTVNSCINLFCNNHSYLCAKASFLYCMHSYLWYFILVVSSLQRTSKAKLWHY